jgi:hypothetical protein
MLLEEAKQRKLYYQIYGTNFQRDLFSFHLKNSNRKKICDTELSQNIILLLYYKTLRHLFKMYFIIV